ncbi:hypothetical protein ACHAXS_010588 [Conticribra weissflogii]
MPIQPQPQPPFRSSNYALGILFLVVVSLLWTACSIVVQHLYRDMEFDSPFLIVYIGTSLFSVFLPSRLVYERRKAVRDRCGRCSRCSRFCCHCCHCCRLRRREREGGENGGVAAAVMEVEAEAAEVEEEEEEEEEEAVVVIPWRHRDEATRPRTSLPLSGGSDWGLALASRSDDVDADDTTVLVDREGHNHNHAKSKPQPQPQPQQQQQQPQQQHKHYPHYLLSHRDHISMASKVAPLWFLSNYFYAQSLRWTSIASSTVLASTGSLFAFGFATCSRFGDERLTKGKLLGVLLCFLGGVATAWTDVEQPQPQTQTQPQPEGVGDITDDERSPFLALAGDAAGLLSAVGYGAYTVLIRHLCPTDEDRMSMQLLFGYIGLWNMVVLFPAALWVAWPDDHRGSHSSALTSSVFLFLLLKGLLDNVLSDYLWARAVILTSATVASVGVGLTIPMAFAADWIVMGNGREGSAGWGDGAGAVLVLLGFLFVNVNVFGEEDGDWNRRDDDGDDDGDGDGDDDDDDEMEEMDFEMEDGRNGNAGSAHDVGILT